MLTLEVGDRVLLDTRKIQTKAPGGKKMLPKYIGPFTVTEKINEVAFRLDLPPAITIHPVFHVSFLKPYHPRLDSSGHEEPPNIPDMKDGEVEWKVQKILDYRPKDRTADVRKMEFCCRFVGHSFAYDEWIPYCNMGNAQESISEFFQRIQKTDWKFPDAPKQSATHPQAVINCMWMPLK
jgi:hypothetical protein